MNRNSAETAAAQTGAEAIRNGTGDLYQRVQLGTTVLEVDARAFMALEKKLSERSDVAFFKECDSTHHTLIFPDHVQGAAVIDRIHFVTAGLQHFPVDIAEHFDLRTDLTDHIAATETELRTALRLPEGLCGELLYALQADGTVIETEDPSADALRYQLRP